MKPLPIALIAGLALGASKAQAADDAAVMALRDSIAPGECASGEAPKAQPFNGGTLYQVPCRNTASDTVSVLILETESGLRPLFFANPEFQFAYGRDGKIDWTRADIGGINVSPVIAVQGINDAAGLIEAGSRMPPGLGSGGFSYRHAVDEWGVTLESAIVWFDTGAEARIWPPAGPSLMEKIGLAHDLEGFNPLEAPEDLLADPLGVVELLTVEFPAHPDEEGRPRMEISMVQDGRRIAMTLLDRGWADDSLDGHAYRVLLELQGEAWAVTGLGKADICGRGAEPITTGLCP